MLTEGGAVGAFLAFSRIVENHHMYFNQTSFCLRTFILLQRRFQHNKSEPKSLNRCQMRNKAAVLQPAGKQDDPRTSVQNIRLQLLNMSEGSTRVSADSAGGSSGSTANSPRQPQLLFQAAVFQSSGLTCAPVLDSQELCLLSTVFICW